jgi:ankyrin repeat protein
VQQLLTAGSDVQLAEAGGATALMIAADRGEADVCQTLIDAGAHAAAASPPPIGLTPLMRAAAKGHTKVVRLLMRAGADPNARAGSKMHGAGALYLAAQGTHDATLRALLDAGAAVEAPVEQVSTTPLFVACERGCAKCAATLLAYGADVHTANWNGVSAAHMTAIRGHLEVLKVLARHVAASAGATAAVRDTAALLDARAHEGSSALLTVAESDASKDEALPPRKRAATLRWLLAAGADAHTARDDGFTPLLAAAAAGHADAVSALLGGGGGAPLAAATLPDGRSALMLAAANGHLATCAALLDGGAPHDERALELAVARREHKLIALLSREDGRA